jgi:hypothetical protein
MTDIMTTTPFQKKRLAEHKATRNRYNILLGNYIRDIRTFECIDPHNSSYEEYCKQLSDTYNELQNMLLIIDTPILETDAPPYPSISILKLSIHGPHSGDEVYHQPGSNYNQPFINNLRLLSSCYSLF